MDIGFKDKSKTRSIETNIKKLLDNIPALRPTIKTLNENNIKYGLYAGAHVAVLTSNREPTDVDLLVSDKDFDKLEKLFTDSLKKGGKGNMSGGMFLYPEKEEKIEFMAYANLIQSEKIYPFRMSKSAWNKVIKYKADGISFILLNPADTVILKAILQRGNEQGKHDLEDIEAIINVINLDQEYLNKRLREIKADEKVFKVLRNFDLLK